MAPFFKPLLPVSPFKQATETISIKSNIYPLVYVNMSDSLNPYASAHAEPAGPGDSRPTALQIVKDNDLLDKWSGKVAFVTGGTSGIGVETAAALHATGADVYFTARDLQKGAATQKDILSRSAGKGKLEVIEMDMDSLDSVRQAVKDFLEKSSTLNVLVNNAGELSQ